MKLIASLRIVGEFLCVYGICHHVGNHVDTKPQLDDLSGE